MRTIQNEQQLELFLIERIAELLQIPPAMIDPEVPHSEYGLDSASAVLLVAELEDELQVELSPSLAWDHPTLRSIVQHLSRILFPGSE